MFRVTPNVQHVRGSRSDPRSTGRVVPLGEQKSEVVGSDGAGDGQYECECVLGDTDIFFRKGNVRESTVVERSRESGRGKYFDSRTLGEFPRSMIKIIFTSKLQQLEYPSSNTMWRLCMA